MELPHIPRNLHELYTEYLTCICTSGKKIRADFLHNLRLWKHTDSLRYYALRGPTENSLGRREARKHFLRGGGTPWNFYVLAFACMIVP